MKKSRFSEAQIMAVLRQAEGRLYKTVTNLEDGSYRHVYFELSGPLGSTKPRWEGNHDAQGREVKMVRNDYDGTRWEWSYEPDSRLGSAKPRAERNYDAKGRLTAATTHLDDGSRWENIYEVDSALGTSKPRFERTYDPSGRLKVTTTNFDDGSSWQNTSRKGQSSTRASPAKGSSSRRGSSSTRSSSSSRSKSRSKGAPVALDLDGDGMVEIRQLSPEPLIDQVQESACETSRPRFDWNGDGAGEQTAWVGSSDGLLAIDLAADGSAGSDGEINQAREIAFAQWKTEEEIASENAAEDRSATRSAITDLEGLRRVFDTNHDDVLDAQDARWSEFRVWQDANQDGVSNAGELRSLDQAGIKLLHLLPSPEDARAFADDSSISGTSHFETGDGKRGLVADVSLAYRPNELASSAA